MNLQVSTSIASPYPHPHEHTHRPPGHFPALSFFSIKEYSLPSTTAAALVQGLDAGCEEIIHLSLGNYAYYYEDISDGLPLVEALVAAGRRGGAFQGLTTLRIDWPHLSYTSGKTLLTFLLGESAGPPSYTPLLAASPFPNLGTLSLIGALRKFFAHADQTWTLRDLVRACVLQGLRDINVAHHGRSKANILEAVAWLREHVPELDPPVSEADPLTVDLAQYSYWHTERFGWQEYHTLMAGWPVGFKITFQ